MGYGYYTPEEKGWRIAVVVLAIAVVVLGIVAVSRCSGNSGNGGENYNWYLYEGEEPGENTVIVSDTENTDDWLDEPHYPDTTPPLKVFFDRVLNNSQRILVREGDRYEVCFLNNYPELGYFLDKDLGGAKLLGETCADANNDKKSRCPKDKEIICPRLKDIGVGVDDSDNGLPNRIKDNDVNVVVDKIDDRGGISGLMYAIFGLNITIENLRGVELDVVIRQGLFLETLGDDVQNIIVRETKIVRLKAYEKRTVRITAYCASRHRTSPVGYTARFTPFYLMAESSVFSSQESVWERQDEWYASYRNRYNSKTDGLVSSSVD